jgi:hypothetical protein
MKALTIWQPWASLIMIGAKPYEFRSWLAPRSVVGKRIVIHAGARGMKRDEVEDLIENLSDPRSAWLTCLKPELALPLLKAINTADALPLGAGLGTALLGTPKVGDAIAIEFSMPGEMMNDSDRNEHPNWGWPMLDIEPWETPLAMSGKQGLWNWPEPGDAL